MRGIFRAALLAAAFCGIAGGAAAEETIRLGSAISLTGKYSTNGDLTRKGYDLAIKFINEQGGVEVGGKAHKLEVVYYDDESTPARGAQLAERLIAQDGVDFVLGPYSSGLTQAMAPVTEKYGVPMVQANGASVSLFEHGYRYMFAVLSTTEQYLQPVVDLAAELSDDPSSMRVGIAIENDPFSMDVRKGVIEDLEGHGMQLVIDDRLPPELNDMAATLTKVRALRPDLLLVSGHALGAALAVRQIEDMRVRVPMVGLTHCDAARIAESFGEAAEGYLCAAQWAPGLSYEDDVFGSAKGFAEAYEEAYGVEPPYQAAESAAAVLVFADAFERAGSLEKDAVREALSETDLMTFFGAVRFDETGKNIAKPMVLLQVQDGDYKVVYPREAAEAELRHPRGAE